MFSRQLQLTQKQSRQLQSNDIEGFYYIIDINNLKSILKNGIYSHNAVRELKLYSDENDISNPYVQNCRKRKFESPGSHKTKELHDYVNFYLQPRNAMLSAIQQNIPLSDICILKIKKELLAERSDAILTNKNAACSRAGNEVKFFKKEQWILSPMSSVALSSRSVFENHANNSKNQSGNMTNAYKQKRQAEALFSHHVSVNHISEIITGNIIAFTKVNGCVEEMQSNHINVRNLPTLFQLSNHSSSRDKYLNFLDFSENKENKVSNIAMNQAWLKSPAPLSPSPTSVSSFFGASLSSTSTVLSTPLPFMYDVSNDEDINNTNSDNTDSLLTQQHGMK